MNRNPDYKFIDFKIFFSYLGLVLLGLYAIFVVEYDSSAPFSLYSEFGKQIIFHLISILIGVVILLLDGKFLMRLSYLIYFFSILLLISVLIFGDKYVAFAGKNKKTKALMRSKLSEWGHIDDIMDISYEGILYVMNLYNLYK